MRKDVECTFGILKGRWRILKTGVRLHGIQVVDKVWLTCCTLHNWLLEEDGNGDEEWTGGVSIDLQCLIDYSATCNLNICNYNLSGIGPGSDVVQTAMVGKMMMMMTTMMVSLQRENS